MTDHFVNYETPGYSLNSRFIFGQKHRSHLAKKYFEADPFRYSATKKGKIF